MATKYVAGAVDGPGRRVIGVPFTLVAAFLDGAGRHRTRFRNSFVFHLLLLRLPWRASWVSLLDGRILLVYLHLLAFDAKFHGSQSIRSSPLCLF